MATKIRIGILGCGSVSRHYLRHLRGCPHAEVTAVGDILAERAHGFAGEYGIPYWYDDVDAMLSAATFDLFVNLTAMQAHESLNRRALEAGRHVWSEKPLANTLHGGRALLALASERGLRIWGAPTVVESPQFAFMAKALARGALGRIAAAHAAYGHLGPDWSDFFYTHEGGSLPDLGVYSLTFLTGLLGPARSVVAMTSIVTPRRHINGQGEIEVTEEDNAMVLLEHADGAISHVACGFNYYDPEDHAFTGHDRHTITITGRDGVMKLVGYDWAPRGVDLCTAESRGFERHADAPHDYVWENGASLAARCLATGREPLCTAEHALHVVEIMEAARESQRTGRRIPMETTFCLPAVC